MHTTYMKRDRREVQSWFRWTVLHPSTRSRPPKIKNRSFRHSTRLHKQDRPWTTSRLNPILWRKRKITERSRTVQGEVKVKSRSIQRDFKGESQTAKSKRRQEIVRCKL